MLYRKVKTNGDSLSSLGFGCMRLPTKGRRIDEKRACLQIRYAIDKGVNYLDTALPYHNGHSETLLGKALQDGYRDKVKIADKLPPWVCKTRQDMDDILEVQLKKLQTDRIDYYLIHAIDKACWDRMKTLGVIDFLDKAKDDGRIINAGFSFHGAGVDFKPIVDDYNWDFCQIQYNILDEYNQAGKSGLEYAASKDLAVIIMEPLRGGSLTTKLPEKVEAVYRKSEVQRSNAEWALRWVWNHPQVTVVLSGMNEEAHIEENIRIACEASPNSLTEPEMATIKEAAETYLSVSKVGCTGCQYCMPCPVGVNIPYVFDLYNTYHHSNGRFMTKATYWGMLGGMIRPEKSLASQCVNCGMCTSHCPQSIDIPTELRNAKNVFEGPFIKYLMKAIGLFMSRKPKK